MKKGTEKKIIAATFDLALSRGWSSVSLSEIARRAKVPLSEIYEALPSKTAILGAYSRQVDLKMLDASSDVDAEDTARDRLFDVIMNRFDAMADDRQALQAIYRDLRRRPLEIWALQESGLQSLRWMLEAAHLDAGGLRGAVRQRVLGALYTDVFATWLKDDDPGLPKTMALLDRRLRRIEDILRRLQSTAKEFSTRGRTNLDPEDDQPTVH